MLIKVNKNKKYTEMNLSKDFKGTNKKNYILQQPLTHFYSRRAQVKKYIYFLKLIYEEHI